MREILGSIPALAIQGLTLAHSNSVYQNNHKTTIINKPQFPQGIVYPRYTDNSQYTIMNTKYQYNQHTPYSQQN